MTARDSIALALAIAAGCGGAPEAPPVVVSSPMAPSAASSAAAPAVASTPPRKIWLSPARVYGASVWFPEELTPIADAAADALAHNGYAPIPNQELVAFREGVQAGKLPGVAVRCETPPPPARLASVVYADAAEADVEVRCESNACALEIVVDETAADGDEKETARYRMPLATGSGIAAWAQAIRSGKLEKINPPDGGFGLIGMLNGATNTPSVTLALMNVVQTGPWARKLDEAMFEPQKAAFDTCEKKGPAWRDWWSQAMLLEVDTRGHVGRCAFQLPDHLPPPWFTCECDVVRKMDFGAASAVRRASLDVHLMRNGGMVETVRRASVSELKSSDRSAILGSGAVDESTLEACLASIASGHVSGAVEFDVGADGRTSRAALAPELRVDARVRACLEKALGTTRFNCPLSGKAHVTGTLEATVFSAAKRP